MKYYNDLLQRGCFTWDDICRLTGNNNTASNLVQRYLQKGLIRRVKRDLYVALDLESGTSVANEYVIASNINSGSFVSYHSAFSYYGLHNQVLFELYVSSTEKFSSFSYQGLKYRFMDSRIGMGIVLGSDGVKVTDLERTIIDNIDSFEKIGGGLEELLECLSLVCSVGEDKLLLYLDCYGKQVLYQKAGYILEHFRDEMSLSQGFFDYCAARVGKSVRYLHHAVKYYAPVFSRRWQLYVPENLLYPLGQGGGPDEYV